MRISDWSSDVCSSDLLEHVDALELDAEVAQHLNDYGREAALREHRGPFHEEHHVVAADLLVDALAQGVVEHPGYPPFRPLRRHSGPAVCRARAWSSVPIRP